MVRDFFSKLLSSEISSFVRISVTVASLYPEVVSAEYCLYDCRGTIVGLEQVPLLDAERDPQRLVPARQSQRQPRVRQCAACCRHSLGVAKRSILSSSPTTGSREDAARLGCYGSCHPIGAQLGCREGRGRGAHGNGTPTNRKSASDYLSQNSGPTSQPSDRQWDCNCISGCRSVVGEAGYRGCLR